MSNQAKDRKARFLALAKKDASKNYQIKTPNAVIYTRVSTKDQADNNASLSTQLRICEDYAAKRGLNVIEYFGGTYESAKSDERKEFNRMLSYVKRNKQITYIIVYSYSRFSRTGAGGANITEQLRSKGIYVLAVTQEVDANTPSGAFQQSIYYAFGNFENQVRKRNMMNGMKAKLKEGYWPLTVPLGYTNLNKGQTADKHRIVVNKEGKLLQRIWNWKIRHQLANTEIVKRLNKAGLKINERRLSDVFRNPFYCGKIVCSFIPDEVIDGKHEAMVTPDTFFRALEILEGRFEKSRHSVFANRQLPLKRFTTCCSCGSPITGYLQKQKNIYYYKCRTKGCKHNKNQKQLHTHFKTLLQEFEINPNSVAHVKKTLQHVFYNHNENRATELLTYRTNLAKVSKKIERLEERFIEEEVSKELFEKHTLKLNREKVEIERLIEDLAINSSNLENCMDWVLEISQNLSNIWESEQYLQSELLQKIIFPDGITYDWENSRFLTSRVNSLFLPIPQMKALSDQKKTGQNDKNSFCPAKSG